MTMYLGFSGSINNSLQIGDVVYYVNTSATGGFTTGDTPVQIRSEERRVGKECRNRNYN